jgi:hypothetical protein
VADSWQVLRLRGSLNHRLQLPGMRRSHYDLPTDTGSENLAGKVPDHFQLRHDADRSRPVRGGRAFKGTGGKVLERNHPDIAEHAHREIASRYGSLVAGDLFRLARVLPLSSVCMTTRARPPSAAIAQSAQGRTCTDGDVRSLDELMRMDGSVDAQTDS